MAPPPPAADPAPPRVPPASSDPLVDVNNAAAWSIDYYNRRAADQYLALVALQIAAGALMGA